MLQSNCITKGSVWLWAIYDKKIGGNKEYEASCGDWTKYTGNSTNKLN